MIFICAFSSRIVWRQSVNATRSEQRGALTRFYFRLRRFRGLLLAVLAAPPPFDGFAAFLEQRTSIDLRKLSIVSNYCLLFFFHLAFLLLSVARAFIYAQPAETKQEQVSRGNGGLSIMRFFFGSSTVAIR